ncbi:6-pyruvoyl tetrahydropterin synthase [Levilactobacillus brevis]|nr:6-pyruvoyl tetrahydropterin synthase [Levilactobacillus brevis]
MAASPERKARLAMKQRSYKIKSYVNASHAVRWKSGTGKKHNHTWEIVCELHVFEGMVSFFEIEKSLNKAINALSGQYLNDLPEFQVINPTVENVTEYLFNEMANYKFNPNKPGIFQWQSVDDVFLMVVD